MIAFIAVALQYVIGFAVALALNSKRSRREVCSASVSCCRCLLAPVAVALIARQIFNPTMGPLNELMSFFGFPNLPFLTQTSWAIGAHHCCRGLAVDAVRHADVAGRAADLARGRLRGGGAGECHALAAVLGHHLPDDAADFGRGRVHPADRELQDHRHGVRHDRRRARESRPRP